MVCSDNCLCRKLHISPLGFFFLHFAVFQHRNVVIGLEKRQKVVFIITYTSGIDMSRSRENCTHV